MELDEIKKIWQEIDLLKEKQQVNEERIKEMLRGKGKSALGKIINVEKFGMIILIPCGILFCFGSHLFFKAGGYYMFYPLILLLFCIVMEPFVIKNYRMLKKFDLSNMTIKEVSEKILKYENSLQKSQIYVMIGFIVYYGIWYYLLYKLAVGSQIVWWLIIFLAVTYSTAIIIPPVFIKKWYLKNINRIKKSLKELEEFEK